MGILDGVMKKQPTEEELQAREDMMMKSSEERYEDEARSQQAEKPKSNSLSQDRTIVQLEKDVELLKVQIELMKQNKQVTDERFSKFSEQVGEIRATVLDSERDGATIKVQAEKAIELIQMVQPERLMMEVKKLEAKIEAAKGMEEKFAAMQQRLVDELKDLRQRTEVIRGSETMLKLNEEVKTELSTALQIQNKMDQRADKIEAIHADFQQHFYEYQKVFDHVKELDSEFKDIMKDFNVFKVKVDSSASKSDFLKLKGELKEYGESLDSKIIEVDKAVAKSEMLKTDILKEAKEGIEESEKGILKKITNAEAASDKINAMQSELQKSILSESLKFKKDFDGRISSLEKAASEFEESEKRLSGTEKSISQLNASKSDIDKARKDIASLVKIMADLQAAQVENGKLAKEFGEMESAEKAQNQVISDYEKRMESVEATGEKISKTIGDMGFESKEFAGEANELDKRLKTIETKTQDYLQKSERKLDSAVSDVADNTSVVRDLVKEVYSLRTLSASTITKGDLSNLQKGVNEKLIVFDMSLIKLEHHLNDMERALRDLEKENDQKMKELRRDFISKLDDLETSKGNFSQKKSNSGDMV
ncbi:MAG: hypothetical protein AABX01_00745 [Candidatus Micrarchaeota archaeon]